MCYRPLQASKCVFFSFVSNKREERDFLCICNKRVYNVTYATVPLEMQETQGKPLHHHSDAPQISDPPNLPPPPIPPTASRRLSELTT